MRFREALSAALEMNDVSLSCTIADNTLESVANGVVLSAVSGGLANRRLLLSLIEDLEPGEDATAVEPKAETGDETGTNSLSQGESQGVFSNTASRSEEVVSEQAVEPLVVPPAGRIEGTAHKIEDVAPPRQKRPTIMVAGEIVQQGD